MDGYAVVAADGEGQVQILITLIFCYSASIVELFTLASEHTLAKLVSICMLACFSFQ